MRRRNLLKNFYYVVLTMLLNLGLSNRLNAQNLPNLGFEYNNLTNWNSYYDSTFALPTTNAAGTANATITGVPKSRGVAAIPGLYTTGYYKKGIGPFKNWIRTTSANQGNDPYGNFPVVCPFQGAGRHSVKIGTDSINDVGVYGRSAAQGITYNIKIPANNQKFKIVYYYAIDLESPSGHTCAEMPFFQADVFDSITQTSVAPCSSFGLNICDAISNDTTKWGSWNKSKIFHDVYGDGSELDTIYYMKWTPATVIAKNMGGRTVTLRFTSAGCTLGAHFGYAYVDLDTTASALNGDTLRYCPRDTCFNFVPPPGYKTYEVSDSFLTPSGKDTLVSLISITPTISDPTIPLCGKLLPKVNSILKVILIPPNGFGCIDTLYYFIDTFPTHILPSIVSPNDSICAGKTMTLTDAYAGLTWVSDSTNKATIGSSSGLLTAVANGIDTIQYLGNNKYGCPDTTKKIIYVGGLQLSSLYGKNGVCLGDTIHLSDSISGGTWSSSNTSVATVSATGVVSGLTYGTVTITYSFANSFGCTSSVTKNLQIGIPPLTAIVGNNSFCTGHPDTLTNATAGGTWESTDTLVASINTSGIVTGLSSGSSIIKYVYAFGGCSDSVTYPINVFTAVAPAISGFNVVCQKHTIQLSDSTTGGVWTTQFPNIASITQQGVVTGVATGKDTITYTVTTPNGCVAASSIVVTVNPAPVMGNIAGLTNVCIGKPSTYTDTTANGVWSSSNINVATISNTGVLTTVSAGSTNIKYVVTNQYGCSDSVSLAITINPNPVIAAINGTDSMCIKYITQFTDATIGGVWSSTNSNIATIGNGGSVLSTSAGNTIIRYTVTTASGCIDSVSKNLIVNPTPPNAAIFSTKQSLCVGDTLQLTDAVAGGVWSSSKPGVVSVTNTGLATALSQGTTIISNIATNAFGCADTTILTLVVKPVPPISPIAGNNVVCVTHTINLTDTVPGGVWTSSNLPVATITNTGIVSGLSSGNTTIKYVYTYGGCIDSVTLPVIVNAPVITQITGNTVVCQRHSITLNNSSVGGIWISLNPTVATINNSGVITTGLAGTDSIKYILPLSNGCLDSVYTVVTVNTTPVVGPISGPLNVCIGKTATYTDTTAAGVWVSMDTTVTNINAVTGVITTKNPGAATLKYTVTNGFGCSDSVFYKIVINPNPVIGPISGNDSFCIHIISQFADAANGGTWTSTSPTIVSIDSVMGVFNTHILGNDTIRYTVVTNMGCVDSVSKPIVVNPSPNITPIFSTKQNMCVGDTLILSDSLTGGTWSSANPTCVSVNSTLGYASSLTAGYAPISYIITNQFRCSDTAVLNLFVNPIPPLAPITGKTQICVGATSYLGNYVSGGNWFSADTSIVSINKQGMMTGKSVDSSYIYYGVTRAGCSSKDSVKIKVFGTPQIASIIGKNEVCLGQSINLTTSTNGGLWQSVTPRFVSIDTLGNLTGVESGTGVISYTVYNAVGCFSVLNDTITVNNLPKIAAITGRQDVCINKQIVLSTTPVGGNWSLVNANATIDATGTVSGIVSGPDTAKYIYTDLNGCSGSATLPINVDPLPVISAISGNTGLCLGTNTLLTDTIPKKGIWVSTDTSTIQITYLGEITGIKAGSATIRYIVTTKQGCTDSVATLITVNPLPIVSPITGPALVCANNTIQLSNASAGPGKWSVTNSSIATIDSITGLFKGIIAGIDSAVYTVVDGNGCKNDKEYLIKINPLPTIDAIQGNATPICKDDNVQLYDYTQGGVWTSVTPAFATINYNGGMLSALQAGIAAIRYTVTTGYGCVDSILGYITIKGKPVVNFIIPTNICLPEGIGTFTSSATVLPQNPNPVSYVWNFGDANNPGLAYTATAIHRFMPIISPTGYNINLIVTANGCTSDTTIVMPASYIHPEPTSSFLTYPAPPEVCLGSTINFADNSTGNGVIVKNSIWYLGDNSIDTGLVLNYQYANASTYWAYHRIIDQYGCISDTSGILVTIDSFPHLYAGAVKYILVGDSAILSTNVSGDIISYNWEPNVFLNNNQIPSPVCAPTSDTTYIVSVTGIGGCVTYDSVKVIALGSIKLPNAFSPNGDGVHDLFVGQDVAPELYQYPNVDVKIFDRQGQVVYASTGSYKPWNGKYNNTGGLVPVGVYYYIIKVGYNIPVISGSVTIFR